MLAIDVQPQEELVVKIGDDNFVLPRIYVGQVIKNNRVKNNINLKQIDFIRVKTLET